MKTFIIIMLFLGTHITSFSQNKVNGGKDEGKMKSIDLPEVVIKSAGKDFSVYLPDKNPDPSVTQLQNEFITYNLGKDYEGFDNYLVILEGEKGVLTATYDEKGKLTGVVEKYSNVQLPAPVIYSIYKTYPGWQIVNDKFLYTQENGDITKKEYNLKIKKENEIIKLKVNPEGEIIAKS
ncbi:hypothetical protein [Flavobacterium laiguense]|uniref:Nicotinate-nucleotide adenylyltransferase n=1 Tax=Flavobacterium laiguense TaxID=2169409 RepID=A0A2U1JTZ7_9FLAO|nr:hypothetical protein [Flavobacterium laiguense]PWA08612.1 hypothetical protein DB891_11430 [Flavobacterium laiguense]